MESGQQSEVQPSAAAKASRLGPGQKRWVIYALLSILLLALVMDLTFYTGFYASDDLKHIRGAVQLAESGRMTAINTATIRVVLLAPLALVVKVTDHNLFAMSAFFALFHLLVILATYYVGRRAHDSAVGVLAAGLVAVCPLAVYNATLILPDHAVTALVLSSIGILLLARQRMCETPPATRSACALSAAAGVVFGLAFGAKITAIIVIPVFGALILSQLRRAPSGSVLKMAIWFAAGTLVAAAFLWLVFYMMTGLYSPFQNSYFSGAIDTFPERVAAKGYPTFSDRLHRFTHLTFSKKYLGLFRWVIPVCLIIYPFLKRRSWAIYLSVIWLCAYMTWGTFSLTHYSPPPVNIRYFILALPFALIAVAFVALSIVRPLWSRMHKTRPTRAALLGLASLAGLLVIGDSCVTANRLAGQLHHSPEVSAVRHALDFAATSGDRPIVLSYWLSSRLRPLFWQDAYPRVIRQDSRTDMAEVSSLLARGGFLYINCAYERFPRHRSPRNPSPLDAAIREALDGRGLDVSARTVGAFGQFKTRFSGIRYLLTGLGDDMDLRRDKRQVFLHEVTAGPPRAEDLDESECEELDLSQRGIWSPTWVHRLESCEVSQAEDGAVVCELAGSDDNTGGQYGGVLFRLGPVRAVRFDVTFERPDQIAAVYMDLTVGTGTKNRLRWEYTPSDNRGLAEGRRTYTFRPDRWTGGFLYVGGPAAPDEVDTAHFFIRLKEQNARAGFRIHRVLVER